MFRFWRREHPKPRRDEYPFWKLAKRIVEKAINIRADAVEVALRRTPDDDLGCTVRCRLDGKWQDMEAPPTRLAVPLFAALIDLVATQMELGDTDKLLKPIDDRLLKLTWEPEPIAKSPGWEAGGMALVIELGRA